MSNLDVLKYDIMRKVIAYFTLKDVMQIAHTQCVANYTYLISVDEKKEERQTTLLEIAAWMHDIGCPDARAKYGNSMPVNQQKEGARITEEWFLESTILTTAEKSWLTEVVGSHHQFKPMQELHAEPLFEADLIVNFLEGYYPKEQLQHYYDTLMITKSGRELYKKIFKEISN